MSLNGNDMTENYKPSGDYHDITRYMREIDPSLARERRQKRCGLFNVYTQLPVRVQLRTFRNIIYSVNLNRTFYAKLNYNDMGS